MEFFKPLYKEARIEIFLLQLSKNSSYKFSIANFGVWDLVVNIFICLTCKEL